MTDQQNGGEASNSGAKQWHYLENQQQVGPVDRARMEQLIAAGVVNRSSYVWKDGMADWVPAEQTELRALLGAPAAASTSAPGPAAAPALESARIPIAELSGIRVPLLISAISNIVIGLAWAGLTLGCALPLSLGLWVLCFFEFRLHGNAPNTPPRQLGSQCLTLGIIEIAAGVVTGAIPTLICGILVIVNSSKYRN